MRGANHDLTIKLPMGFEVTYTHERQPAGRFVHLSVSVDNPGRTPHPAAVDMILTEFGMKPIKESVNVWLEDYGDPAINVKAVNVLQRR